MSRLKEIEERCEKAAPEPWCSHDPGMYCGYACTPDGCYENHDSPVRQLEGPHTEWPEPNGGPVDDGTLQCFTIADADFIAHARSDIPYLISELRASLARAERAEALVREAREMLDNGRECDDCGPSVTDLKRRIDAALQAARDTDSPKTNRRNSGTTEGK